MSKAPYALGLALAMAVSSCHNDGSKQARPFVSRLGPQASIVEIMGAMVDPSADALWASYSWISDVNGTTFHHPETEADWRALRKSARALIDSVDLLMMPGRPVSRSTDTREAPPSPGDLTPEQSLALINAQRATFNALARSLQDGVRVTLSAIDKHDLDAYGAAVGQLDGLCEACHTAFWYPNQQAPE